MEDTLYFSGEETNLDDHEDLSDQALDDLFPVREDTLDTLSDMALKVMETDTGKPLKKYITLKSYYYHYIQQLPPDQTQAIRMFRWKQIIVTEDPYIIELLHKVKTEYEQYKQTYTSQMAEWSVSNQALKSERARRVAGKRMRTIQERKQAEEEERKTPRVSHALIERAAALQRELDALRQESMGVVKPERRLVIRTAYDEIVKKCKEAVMDITWDRVNKILNK